MPLTKSVKGDFCRVIDFDVIAPCGFGALILVVGATNCVIDYLANGCHKGSCLVDS